MPFTSCQLHLPWRFPHSHHRSCILFTSLLFALAIAAPAQAPTAIPARNTHPASANANAASALDSARRLLATPRWQDAFPLVQTYIASHDDSADAHALMGLILYRKHEPRASMAEYVRASELADLTAFDLRIFALDCAAIPDLPEAEKWLLRSIEKNDGDAATWEALGHVRFESQQYEASIEALNRCLQLVPHTVSAEALIGLSNERLARPDAAEKAYRTAIQWQASLKEKDPIPFVGLGRVLIGDNRPEDAIPWLLQAEKTRTTSPDVHEFLGQAYSKTGRQTEAAEELEKAVRLQPENARLHLMLSRAYRSLGAKQKADAELRIYAKLNGSDAR